MRALRRKRVQHFEHIDIAGYDPGMEENIPVYWILGAQTAKERIGVSQHLRVQKMIET
jgi:hypothetical protein